VTESEELPEEMEADLMIVHESKEAKRIERIIVMTVAWICVILLGAGSFYFYAKYAKTKVASNSNVTTVANAPSNGGEQGKSDIQTVKEAIEKLMELPTNEDPVVATVTDIDKIRSQKFFANGQNGDRVLIYKENKKAILYRPAINKIIEVSQVSGLDGQPADPTGTPTDPNQGVPASSQETKLPASEEVQTDKDSATTESSVKVAVYNGSTIKGLAQKIGDKTALIPGVAITQKINATGNYEKTVVVDLSGSHLELAKKIAESLGGEISALPTGETKPTADILIIGGSDFKAE